MSVDSVLLRREAKLAADCLRVPYLGRAHEALYKRVCQLRKMAVPVTYYSVYSSFIQSSGLGKTRASLEMSQLGVYICYCSTASVTSPACPGRTPLLADKLSVGLTETKAVLYLKAWIRVLKKRLDSGVSATAWMQMQRDGTSIFKQVAEEWRRLEAERQDAMEVDENEQEQDRGVANFLILEEEAGELATALSKQMQPPVHNEVCVRVVFVFDEARGLLSQPAADSAFYQIRRALRTFFFLDDFFALVLDTDAKVNDRLPTDDQSARARPFGVRLLPPIYFLPTGNFYPARTDLTSEQYAHPSTWLRYGRPLWGARLDMDVHVQKLDRVKWRYLVDLAGKKLVGELKLVVEGKMTQSQAMAMLGAAAGLDICPRSVLPETLVASHMSILLRVTADRSKMFLTPSLEPVLSEAAAYYLCQSEEVQVSALKHMVAICKEGYVTPGPMGEFVAKYILVAAVWGLKGNEPFCLRRIPVRTYLRKLLYNSQDDQLALTNVLSRLKGLEGHVFFNSFVVTSEPPDEEMLRRCWISGRAMMYKAENNFPGADLIIPVWTEAGMTAIVISVKNLRRAGWLEKVSVDMVKCEFTQIQVAASLPVVTVAMSLREPVVKSPTNWIVWEDAADKDIHLTCYGIKGNYSFLSKRVKELLLDVLVTVPDPQHGCTEEEKEWFNQMLRMTQPL